jgi:hypothetical protein
VANLRAISPKLLEEELSPFIELEEGIRWLPLPADAAELETWRLPEAWLPALSGESCASEKVAALWVGLKALLPRTLAVFAEKLYGLALLRTQERGLSLVYVFNDDGDLSAQRGFAPPPALPKVAGRFPVDLAPFYRVHDGLVNFMSEDGGPLPIAEWKTLVDPVSKQESLVKIAINGPDAFGFDISEDPVEAYAVWPEEEEVDLVKDPWAFLDELIAAPFEDE